jgi:putative spermidine/putrescine transport system permease protein
LERGDLRLSTAQDDPVAPVPRRRGRRAGVLTALGALPFFLYVAVFLLLPIGVLAVEAFRATDPVTFEESWSTASIETITGGAYGRAYLGSLQLSATTAVLGAVLGLALAVAVLRARRGRLLRRLVLTASGVLANFGGIPLAFAFLATIGNAGVVTALLSDTLGVGLGGFSLYSMAGLALVYLYFLIPLMVLTITPAIEALRPQWREAADNLGASGWQYWRYVGGPVLAPPVIGATMLLFASAFAAYATARALVGSSIPLVTLQIADALSSNVVVGSENLGKALALGMVLLIGLVMIFYAWVQRRTQRWLA